jgi:hypothetical protein
VTVVQKWSLYLLGKSFIVKTYQQSLKFLLEQCVATVPQQRWISKLLGYDFLIEYKHGKENRVTDALSRQFEDQDSRVDISISLISFPHSSWIAELKESYLHDEDTKDLLLSLQQGQLTPKEFTIQ